MKSNVHMVCHKVHLICLWSLVCGAILVGFDLTGGELLASAMAFASQLHKMLNETFWWTAVFDIFFDVVN